MNAWRVGKKEWKGETAYIIGGGPSLLTQDLGLLKGRNVIVINSSYAVFHEAQYLVFSDMRWWCVHIKNPAIKNFKGLIVSTSAAASGHNVVTMQRKSSPGLSDELGTLMVRNTTLTAAINLAVHLGAVKIVLLGIDQKVGDGGRHWHHEPHQWRPTANCFQRQQTDLPQVAKDLKARNIECVNASPGSALTLWPIVNLEDHVEFERTPDIAAVA